MLVLNGGMVVKEVFDTSFERDLNAVSTDTTADFDKAKLRLNDHFDSYFTPRVNYYAFDFFEKRERIRVAAEAQRAIEGPLFDNVADPELEKLLSDNSELFADYVPTKGHIAPVVPLRPILKEEVVEVIDFDENNEVEAILTEMATDDRELFAGYEPVRAQVKRAAKKAAVYDQDTDDTEYIDPRTEVDYHLQDAHIAGREDDTDELEVIYFDPRRIPVEAWGAAQEDLRIYLDDRKETRFTYWRRRIVGAAACVAAAVTVSTFIGLGSYITSADAAAPPEQPKAPVVDEVATPTTMPAPVSTTIYVAPTTTIQPEVAPEPIEAPVVETPRRTVSERLSGWLEKLRQCESTNTYTTNTGNGYYGAYQFLISTWDSVASRVRPDLVGVRPDLASPEDQDFMIVANTNMAKGGLATQNPGCYRSEGLSQFPPEA